MDQEIQQQIDAVRSNWTHLGKIENPSLAVIKEALRQSGWAIQYIANPSEELQLLAVETQYDALKFIGEPTEAVQLAAIMQSYQAVRFLNAPTLAVQLAAVSADERAVQLMSGVTKDVFLAMIAVNPLVMSYRPKSLAVTREDVEAVLEKTVSQAEVDVTFMKRLLTCPTFSRKGAMPMDMVGMVDQHGSPMAKRLLVDIKLRQG